VLIEAKPDKRTVTYKEIKKVADVIECVAWTDRDTGKAEQWLRDEATAMDIALDTKSAQLIVRRVGVDQWQLHHALEKLSLAEVIDSLTIEALIDATPSENVFNLFDAALRGDRRRVADMLATLELTEDPYRLFGLLAGQAFQLAAVANAGPGDDVAKDIGVHPYAVSKLQAVAKKMGRRGAKKVIEAFAKADDDIKLSRADPWLLIERTLIQITVI
jgi:DNA polymerase III delta subunit